ncbi:MAG: GNAT family N-acetyltransferase [Akkermansiaceae bacterium]|nr:GNAT family N-acetyltransferase [Armatimonadota bacterium]
MSTFPIFYEAVTLRPATDDDAPAVADVYLASRRAYVPFAPLAHEDGDVRGWIRDVLISAGQVAIAEEAGRVVGMMALSRDDESGWIDHVYLLPGTTGRGIGSLFVTGAKAELGSPIRLYTFQENHGARRFYERHGFVAISFGDGSGNEEKCPDVLYEWRAPSRDAAPKPLTETNP